MPESCSAPKQRKMDSVNPKSIMGFMMTQDQSLYCEHNNANSMNSLNDVAFKDTHATVSVPGDVWQHTSPKPAVGSLMKSEANMQDMMETLQQILGDSDLTETFELEPEELRSWESTLLKMNTNTCELSEDLNDILNQDILSYVEEQLQKEGGLKLPDQLDNVAACLLNQGPDPGVQQNFGWPLEPQSQLIPNGGQMMAGDPSSLLGTMKLTHMDLPQLSSSGLNGPFQQMPSQQTLPPSVGLHAGLGSAGAATMTFDPSLAEDCAENQLRSLQVTVKDNNLGLFALSQPNQLCSNQMAPQMQNHLQQRTSNLPGVLQDQSSDSHSNPLFNFPSDQWNSSVHSSVHADSFLDSCTQNISGAAGFRADPSSSSCLQSPFAPPTQGGENQRQSWPLKPQQQLVSNGHQQMGNSFDQISGFQRNPLPGVATPQNAVHCGPMFRIPGTPNVPFPAPQDLEPSPPLAASSCMFSNSSAAVPVNEVHLSQVPSCQRLNAASRPIPSKPSCFYQGHSGGGSGPGMTAVPTPGAAQLSCQMTPGLDPDGLLVQPYLNFSDQTQVTTVYLL